MLLFLSFGGYIPFKYFFCEPFVTLTCEKITKKQNSNLYLFIFREWYSPKRQVYGSMISSLFLVNIISNRRIPASSNVKLNV